MNKVILFGRTATDIDVKYTGERLAIASFRMAVNRMKKGEADFFNCKAFGKTAENIGKYFSKGDRILVEGRLQTNSYTNKEGQKVNSVEIVVEGFDFAETKKQETKAESEFMELEGEELPFNF